MREKISRILGRRLASHSRYAPTLQIPPHRAQAQCLLSAQENNHLTVVFSTSGEYGI